MGELPQGRLGCQPHQNKDTASSEGTTLLLLSFPQTFKHPDAGHPASLLPSGAWQSRRGPGSGRKAVFRSGTLLILRCPPARAAHRSQAAWSGWEAQSRRAAETTFEERKELRRPVMGPIKASLKPLRAKLMPTVPLPYGPSVQNLMLTRLT